MAKAPCIDVRCPLPSAEAAAIRGQCHVCQSQVHDLDGLTTQQRRDLLSAAPGAVCVRYSVAVPLALAMGVATLGPMTADANERESAPLLTTVDHEAAAASPVPQASLDVDAEQKALDRIVMVGGVNDPSSARWLDDGTDDDLPELPIVNR